MEVSLRLLSHGRALVDVAYRAVEASNGCDENDVY